MSTKPPYNDLYKFWESCLVLFAEGVEFMTKEDIYDSIKAECMSVAKSPRDLMTPLLCPRCGWQGTVEENDIKIDYDRNPDGSHKPDLGTMWQCPVCEMMIHAEDQEG